MYIFKYYNQVVATATILIDRRIIFPLAREITLSYICS